MDKSKIMFYRSQKEIEQNAEQILKDWKRYPDGEHIFSAMHKESGLHVVINEETGYPESPNIGPWFDHMKNDEGLTETEASIYREKLSQEFGFWVKKEDERLCLEAEKAQREGEQAANAINAFAGYVIANMQNKAKS